MSDHSTIGLRALAALIDTDDVSVIDTLQPELFKGLYEEEAWKFVKNHIVQHGAYPKRDTILETTDIALPETTEPLSFYRDKLVDRHVHQAVKKSIIAASDKINIADPHGALAVLTELTKDLAGLEAGSGNDAKLITAADLMKPATAPDYLVGGMLEQATSVGLVGPFASGKSLFALNIAACVATGAPFHGRKVTPGLAVYLCGEGQSGMYHRAQALQCSGAIKDMKGARFAIFPRAVPLTSQEGFREVRQIIKRAEQEFDTPLTLLIVDTFARYFAGEENSSSDVGDFLRAIDELRGDATSIVVHHTGHKNTDRARGASVWDPALDTSMVVRKDAADTGLITVTCAKQKDGSPFAPVSFRITPADTLSAREDGSPIQSVVLELTDEIAAKPVTGKNQSKLLVALKDAVGEGHPPTWTEFDLRQTAKKLGIEKSSAWRTVKSLITSGQLVGDGMEFTLKGYEVEKVVTPIGVELNQPENPIDPEKDL